MGETDAERSVAPSLSLVDEAEIQNSQEAAMASCVNPIQSGFLGSGHHRND